MTIPEDIRATAERIMEKASGEDLCEYIMAVLMDERNAATERERERAAAGLEQKAAKMRGSPTGDMMARIFEAEATAIRTPDQTQPANPEE